MESQSVKARTKSILYIQFSYLVSQEIPTTFAMLLANESFVRIW